MHLYILGRQPKLGLAELETLCGAGHVAPFGSFAAIVSGDQPDFNRLGGSIKRAVVRREIPFENWKSVQSFLLEHAATLFAPGTHGKHTLSLSVYGHGVTPKQLNTLLFAIKKQLRTPERPIRTVGQKTLPHHKSLNSKEPPWNEKRGVLDSAEVIHNGLLKSNGRELVVVIDGQRALIGLTEHEQDIASYTKRDRERPRRDTRVGMLPPKLAQMMLNLAVGRLEQKRGARSMNQECTLRVLDPFCGTGVLLQEMLLMGFLAYGTDINQRMTAYADANIQWLRKHPMLHAPCFMLQTEIETADATTHTWRQPVDVVAAETYLGPPLRSLPGEAKLEKIVTECDALHRTFLQNLAPQLKSGTPLCLAVPAWRSPSPNSELQAPNSKSFRHLPVIDDLHDLGYNQIDFMHVRREDLLYHREGQIIARQLLVLTRK